MNAQLLAPLLVVLLTGYSVQAQTVQQTVSLSPGWNAVFLKVDPTVQDAGTIFTGQPVDAVWLQMRTLREYRSADCDPAVNPDSADCIPEIDSGWRVWYPPDTPQGLASTLHSIRGGRVYLIKASDSAQFTIAGEPDATPARWRSGASFGGFHVGGDARAKATFDSFLEASPDLAQSQVYTLAPDGSFVAIQDKAAARIASGAGYVITSDASAVFDGPLKIDARSLRGIRFEPGAAQHVVTIQNLAPHPTVVTISNRPAVAGSGRTATGTVTSGMPLVFRDAATVPGTAEWNTLDKTDLTLSASGEPGAVKSLRIAFDPRVATAQPEPGTAAHFEGILEVESDLGSERQIAMSADSAGWDGLWVGQVTVTGVSQLTVADETCACDVENLCVYGSSPGTACLDVGDCDCSSPARPVGSVDATFTFRVILHRSDAGVHTLLRDATLAWQPNADPLGGHDYTIITSQSQCDGLMDALELATERLTGEKPFYPRVSTAAFSIDGVTLYGAFGDGSAMTTLGTTLDARGGPIVIDAFDPLNPYRHLFHPDHNCTGYCDWPESAPCGVDTDCCPSGIGCGWDCTDSQCEPPPCISDADCGAGLCIDDSCAAACATDDECHDGTCRARRCVGEAYENVVLCAPSDDCGEDAKCELFGGCVEPRRDLTFKFQTAATMRSTDPQWGDTLLGGTYTESINGIHRKPLVVEGVFIIQKVADVARLCEEVSK